MKSLFKFVGAAYTVVVCGVLLVKMKFKIFGLSFGRSNSGSRKIESASVSISTPSLTVKPDVELVEFHGNSAADTRSVKNDSKSQSNPELSAFKLPDEGTPHSEAAAQDFMDDDTSGAVYNSLSVRFDPNAGAMPRFPEALSEASPLRGDTAPGADHDDDLFPRQSSRLSRRTKRLVIFLGAVVLSAIILLGTTFVALKYINSASLRNETETHGFNHSDIVKNSSSSELNGNTDDIDADEPDSPESVALSLMPALGGIGIIPIEFPIPDVKTRAEREFRKEISSDFAYDVPKASPLIKSSLHPSPIIIPIPALKMANKSTLEDGLRGGKEALELRQRTEARIHQLGFSVGRGAPEAYSQYHSHQHGFNDSLSREAETTLQMSLIGFSMDRASRIIAKRLNLTKAEAQQGIPVVTKGQIDLKPNLWCAQESEKQPSCNLTSVYSNVDGSCNNLNHPSWGAILQPYRRILLPDYADGISRPRVAADGSALPNARYISETLFKNTHQDDSIVSMMFPLWAEFIEHDLDYTVQSVAELSDAVPCCENGTLLEIQHPECFPIYVNDEDPIYGQISRHCMTVLRSAAAPSCAFGPREQFSKTTPFLDASTIYGSTNLEMSALRETGPLSSGRLKMSQTVDGHSVLKALTSSTDYCNVNEEISQQHFCFESGDDRVNQNLALTSMHLIWTRQHNAIAQKLAVLNPHWNDERIFQESRRLVIAQIQQITFKEYLPLLLGPEVMKTAHLELLDIGYYEGYQKRVDPGISNVFSVAASYFRHSMIQGLTQFVQSNGKDTDFIETHKLFFNPFPLWTSGNLESLLRGYATAAAARADTSFSDQITNHMFQVRNGSVGYDMAAMSIQQSRDHGLPGYTSWRKICGFDPIRNFTDVKDIWNISVEAAAAIYKSVEDIDLLVGGLAELPVSGGVVGPTFACLLADQFARIRIGDRFWFEGNIQPVPFTLVQLEEIRRVSLASILCENTDSLGSIQKHVFQQISPTNSILPCTELLSQKFNYSAWQESPSILESILNPNITSIPVESNPSVDAEILQEFAEAEAKSNYSTAEHHFELLENVLDKHTNTTIPTTEGYKNLSSFITTTLPAVLNELSLDRNNISSDEASTQSSNTLAPFSIVTANPVGSN